MPEWCLLPRKLGRPTPNKYLWPFGWASPKRTARNWGWSISQEHMWDFFVLFCVRFYLFIFREGEGKEKERGRNISVREKHQSVASQRHPDWELNRWPFALWNDAQLTEPHWSGQNVFIFEWKHFQSTDTSSYLWNNSLNYLETSVFLRVFSTQMFLTLQGAITLLGPCYVLGDLKQFLVQRR